MSNLRIVKDNQSTPAPSFLTGLRESRELTAVREGALEQVDAGKIADAARALVRAAQMTRPSKSLESVSAWVAQHADAVGRGETDIGDLREACVAAADELDAVAPRDSSLRRDAYETALRYLGREAPAGVGRRSGYEVLGGWSAERVQTVKHLAIGAGIGLAVGFGIGLLVGRR